MPPRLEDVRRRLLTSPTSDDPGKLTTSALAKPGIAPSVSTAPRYKAIPRHPEASSPVTAGGQRSSQTGRFIEETTAEVPMVPESDEEAADAISTSSDGLAQAVAELFEPARQCQGRLMDIAQASKAISRLTRLAIELREPLKSFHDNIRKLSTSFESMRRFRDELGTLAESFPPVEALHQQVIQMARTVQMHLAEMADGLEPAKALKVESAELTGAMDSLSELQARFYELSEAFADTNASSGTT